MSVVVVGAVIVVIAVVGSDIFVRLVVVMYWHYLISPILP